MDSRRNVVAVIAIYIWIALKCVWTAADSCGRMSCNIARWRGEIECVVLAWQAVVHHDATLILICHIIECATLERVGVLGT